MTRVPDKDRARRTLYVTAFNSKVTTKRLLEELFTQGGPIVDITMFDTHAYVLFQHEESVPYCLALFNGIEINGQQLRLNPRIKTKDNFCFMNYLATVRNKLMSEYRKIPPPELPPKQEPVKKLSKIKSKPTSQEYKSTPIKANKSHGSKRTKRVRPKKKKKQRLNKYAE